MNRRSLLSTAALGVVGLTLLPCHTFGQQQSLKERLLGTWTLVAIDSVRQDGSRSPLFGTDPKGIAFFDRNGYYIVSVMRQDRRPFAVNDRMQGTAEENKATSQGTITYFGTYEIDETDRAMLIRIDASSFPNWNGADQKRLVTITENVSAIGDRRLKLTVPPQPTGGQRLRSCGGTPNKYRAGAAAPRGSGDRVVKRRTFLAGTDAVLIVAPLVAEAQKAGKSTR